MRHSVVIVMAALVGCGQLDLEAPSTPPPMQQSEDVTGSDTGLDAGSGDTVRVAPPPPTARTVEDFDTATSAQRAEAAASQPSAGAEQALGTTIASLGDPAQPGFWLETPLVSEETAGRVVFQGQSATVTLRPIDGPATSGSRISLSAMRLIGAPLTGLPEITVFAQ